MHYVKEFTKINRQKKRLTTLNHLEISYTTIFEGTANMKNC